MDMGRPHLRVGSKLLEIMNSTSISGPRRIDIAEEFDEACAVAHL